MAIEITCTGCRRALHLPDAAAGKKGKCPYCGAVLQVPAVEEQPLTEADLEFQSTSEQPPSTYRPLMMSSSTSRKWPMSAKLTVGSLAVCLIAVAAAVIVGKNPFLRGSSETPLQIEQPDQHKTGVMTQTQDSETPLRIEQPDQHKTDGTKQTEDAGAKREKAAISYINADFASRYKYVLNGAALREEMAKYYSHSGVNSVEKTIAVGVTVLDENRAIVAVAANRGNADVYLRRAGDDWLVDWPATVGLNEVTVKVIKATAPKSSIRLRVKAQLDDSYYDGIRREDYYSISLTENWRPLGDYDSLNGYVLKDSKIGKDLFRIVSDGREHQVIVTVQCIRGGGMDLAMVMIDSLVSENWFVD